MTAREGIRWLEVAEGRWEASSGSYLVGVVCWDSGYAVRSSGGEVSGTHSTLDSAKAQLEGWVRWLDSTDAD